MYKWREILDDPFFSSPFYSCFQGTGGRVTINLFPSRFSCWRPQYQWLWEMKMRSRIYSSAQVGTSVFDFFAVRNGLVVKLCFTLLPHMFCTIENDCGIILEFQVSLCTYIHAHLLYKWWRRHYFLQRERWWNSFFLKIQKQRKRSFRTSYLFLYPSSSQAVHKKHKADDYGWHSRLRKRNRQRDLNHPKIGRDSLIFGWFSK